VQTPQNAPRSAASEDELKVRRLNKQSGQLTASQVRRVQRLLAAVELRKRAERND
jgi:hypothetical protein